MKGKKSFILIITGLLILLNTAFIVAQEDKTSEAAAVSSVPEVQWLWGEVVSVDVPNKLFVVKYLDYDTDTEKEMSINVDEQTVFENIKSLEEIKAQDTVSIDYLVSSDGKNIAKNISLEKIENEGTLPPEETAVVPEKVGSGPISEKSELPQESAEENSTTAAEPTE